MVAAARPDPAHPDRGRPGRGSQGLGDRIDLTEVEQVYLPLSRLIELYISATRRAARGRRRRSSASTTSGTPFVIGVAGSVAVGKSTTSRLLRELLARWPSTPRVELVTTDGFLLPNAELERRGLLQRKGFPESYDRRGAAAVRQRRQGRAGRGEGPGLRPPHLRHRARRARRRPPPRRADRRGPQRAAAGPARVATAGPAWRSATSSTSRSTSTPASTTCGSGTSSGSCGCGPRPSPTRSPTSTATRPCPTTRRSTTAQDIWHRSTNATWSRTCCRPGPGPAWCSPRAPTTPSPGCCCASSDSRRASRQAVVESRVRPTAGPQRAVRVRTARGDR